MDPLRRQVTDKQMERLMKVINLLRLYDREFPAQLMSVLLYVASHKDCHKQALEEDLNISMASSSRNTDWLSDRHRLNKPGLGLIRKSLDPSYKRRQILSLTKKGEDLVNQIKAILYE
tara:strand:+ start:730 stop:1083 length:354 start_codon:yes stop_codon:yes gene_type:complete